MGASVGRQQKLYDPGRHQLALPARALHAVPPAQGGPGWLRPGHAFPAPAPASHPAAAVRGAASRAITSADTARPVSVTSA